MKTVLLAICLTLFITASTQAQDGCGTNDCVSVQMSDCAVKTSMRVRTFQPFQRMRARWQNRVRLFTRGC